MKRIIFILLTLCVSTSLGKAQADFPLDTVIKMDYMYYCMFDSLEVICLSSWWESEPNGKYLFVNKHAIDSTGVQTRSIPIYFDGEIYFNADRIERDLEIKKYNLKQVKYCRNGDLKEFYFKFHHDNGFNQFYIVELPYTSINIVKLPSGEKYQFIDLIDIVEKENFDGKLYPIEEISDVFFLTPQKVILKLCLFDEIGTDCINEKFYVCENNTKYEITKKIFMEYDKENYIKNSHIEFFSITDNIFRFRYNLMPKYPIYKEIITSKIFDENFNFISNVLNFSNIFIKGINIQKNKLQYYFLSSQLNDGKEVIVPYKFLPKLDIAMYKVYNNNLLTDEDVKGLGKYELGILRNLIFAKHNYAFDSEFYQAYFNLYEFYNNENMKSSRTKDINNKLTEMDKKNLEIIKNKEKLISIVKK